MNKENTKDLTVDEKLDMVLAELAFLKADFGARLAKVEAFVEDRSRDTRPMLDKLYKEVADTRIEVGEVKSHLKRLERKRDVLNEDVMEVRIAQREMERDVDRRMATLEHPAA